MESCADCYISPLHPSAHTAAYSAHNPCRRREAWYLAFYWIPVKSHRPKLSRAISSVFQYLVLYTLHQPQYIVVSNGAMNMCILHKYLRYNILWLIMHSYTIYRHATRSARSAVSRALCSYRYSLPAACKTCDTAHFSQAMAVLPATPAHSTARTGNPGFLCILHKNQRQKLRNSVQNFIEIGFFGFRPQYIVDFDPFYPIQSPSSCIFTQVAFGSNPCYHMLESKGKGAATGGAAPPHLRRVAPQGTSRRVPCQVDNAQSKPLTRTA